MAWTGLGLTVKGQKALNQAQMANMMNVKSVVVGDGQPPTNFNTVDKLVHQLYEITNIRIDVTDSSCIITADFPKVDYDYYFREVGIIVTTNEGDVLYEYDNCGNDAEFIVNTTGVENREKRLRLQLIISDVKNINVSIPGILYVDYKTFEASEKKYTEEIAALKNPKFTESTELEELESNESIFSMIGKIAKAIHESILHFGSKSNPHSVTKSQVGLGNVDNTSDTNKPVSAHQQAALDKKLDKTGDLAAAKVTYTEAGSLMPLASGEKMSTAFGKLAKLASAAISHFGSKSNPHQVTKAQVGLGNVENKSSAIIREEITKQNVTAALGYTPLDAVLKGAKNGVAELDATGRVPSAQLPSFVDDVLEGYLYNGKFYKESTHTTEIPGEDGKIYVDIQTNKTYRWSGTKFAEISPSLALGETSSTAYRGDRGAEAYAHAQTKSGNPHGVTKAEVGLGNVDNTADANKPVSKQQRTELDKKLDKTGDAQANVVTFTSGDSLAPTGWANVELMASKETLGSLIRKASLTVKNVRYLYKMLGTTDISALGGGTVTGAIGELNSKLLDFKWKNVVFSGNWWGGVSFAENKNTAISRIFGKITHTSAAAPQWGELVGKLPDYYNERAIVIMSYSEMGKVYNTFVLTTNGEIRCYGSDKSQMTTLDENIFIQTTF